MINAAEHIPLAHSIVNQLCVYDFINRYEKEDLLQIAYAQLTIAANRDKAYNIRRNEPHHYKVYSLDIVFDNNGDKPTPVEDILNTGNEFEDTLVNNIDLKAAIAYLDKPEREIIELYYFDDLNQSEIADLLNTSQVQVSRKLKQALEKMKKYLEGR